MSIVEKVIKHALKLGADEVHVVYKTSKSSSVDVEMDRISRTSFTVKDALIITVIVGKRIATASINEVTLEKALACAEKAYKMARALEPNKYWESLPEPKPFKRVEGLYDKRVAELTADQIVEMAKLILSTVKEVSEKVSVMGASVGSTESTVELATSRGFHGEEKYTTFSASVVTVAKEGPVVGSFAAEADASRSLDVNVEEVARRAAHKALESLHLKPVTSFKGTLVMDYEFAALFFLSLASAYDGYMVWRGSSPLKGKIGEKIASETLTIIDDGTLPGGLGSSSFDAEGTPTMRKTVIEKGVLKTFLNNTFTARLLNMEPTGNAASLLSVTPSNTIIQPGDWSEEELIKDIKKGVFVSRFSGLIRFQDGVISGTAKQAFYIENGEKKYPVKECMITGNLYDFIKNISALTKKTRRTPFNVITPIVRVENVDIVSK